MAVHTRQQSIPILGYLEHFLEIVTATHYPCSILIGTRQKSNLYSN